MCCRRQWNPEFSWSSIIVCRTSANCKLRGCYGSRPELVCTSWRSGGGTSSRSGSPPAPSSGLPAALLCPPPQRSLWSPGKIPAAPCDSSWSPDGRLLRRPWTHCPPAGWRSRSDLLARSGGGKSVGLFRTAPAGRWTGRRRGRGRPERRCSKRERPPRPRLSGARCVPSRRPSCSKALSSSLRWGRTKTPPGLVRKSWKTGRRREHPPPAPSCTCSTAQTDRQNQQTAERTSQSILRRLRWLENLSQSMTPHGTGQPLPWELDWALIVFPVKCRVLNLFILSSTSFRWVFTIFFSLVVCVFSWKKLSFAVFLLCLPAETNLLVDHQSPLQGPWQPPLKPALAAEHGREADGRRHVAGRAALAQVRQQEARAGALARGVQAPRRLLRADVANGLPQVSGVTERLQPDGGEGGLVVAAAVENHREVAVEQSRFTKLEVEEGERKPRLRFYFISVPLKRMSTTVKTTLARILQTIRGHAAPFPF